MKSAYKDQNGSVVEVELTSDGNIPISVLSLLTPNGDSVFDDDVDGLKTNMATGLSKTIDSITARPEGTTYVNMSASALVRTGTGILVGMFVNSVSFGSIKLWDNTSAASTVLNNTITPPAVGYYPLGNASFGVGLYATINSTLDVTLYYIPTS